MNSSSYSPHSHSKNNSLALTPNNLSLSPLLLAEPEHDKAKFVNRYKFSPLAINGKQASLSPSITCKPQTILTSSPTQSLTSQIYDNDAICAHVCNDDDNKHDVPPLTLTNTMHKMESLLLTKTRNENNQKHFRNWSMRDLCITEYQILKHNRIILIICQKKSKLNLFSSWIGMIQYSQLQLIIY